MDYQILFEDNHILVVYKERGILSQADGSSTKDILTELKNYIKIKYNKPGNVYLGLVHRLDRNTSGVMVFAKTSKAAKRLSESIQNKEFDKKYYAIVEGNPKSQTLTDYLLKDEKEKKSYIHEKGKLAILDFKVIKKIIYRGINGTLIDVDLKTGRFHQIRCQLANIGSPLVGDKKYGSVYDVNYYLDCYYLSFVHPTTKEKMEFEYLEKKEKL